ncbi:hypothetical protein A4A36_06745 [Bacillus subtilis]|nr:hypothetical protein A4A36_06745 [Bacillus subtilis]OIS67508.1 hypothetical protein A4A37_16290 [Bacillus subtilis]OIS68982.1 hypothetical protein A4A35_07715 [Bacillus subtilis]TII13586.1 hypothetical protein C6Y43_19210 [Bacillus subtilis]
MNGYIIVKRIIVEWGVMYELVDVLEKTKDNICKSIEQYFDNDNYEDPFALPFVDTIIVDTFYQESRIIIKALASKQNI